MDQVHFGKADQYDKGVTPECAVSSDNVTIEVHQSQNEDTLWYHVGRASVYGVYWGPSYKYDGGRNPSIAVQNDLDVVEVHQSQNEDSLWYHVGKAKGEKIKFGPSFKYDSGVNPSVAVNNSGVVIEVHQSQNEDTLWYHIGILDEDRQSIQWGPSRQYDKGITPKVAINNYGLVVEVHQSQNEDTLWCRVGEIDGDQIHFGPSQCYDKGVRPCIDINDQSEVVEVHKSENADTLWSHTGQVDGTSINFLPSINYDTGVYPTVACNETLALETHRSENNETLWCGAGLIVDHANWMKETEGIRDKQLWQVTLPGSHDSMTYYLTNNFAEGQDPTPEWIQAILDIGKYVPLIPTDQIKKFQQELGKDWSRAQEQSALQQLNGGVRFFDIRPSYYDNDYYSYHGLVGSRMSSIFEQIAQYMSSVESELVILKVSHFNNFNDQRHREFIQLIGDRIQEYLYCGTTNPADLLTTTVGQFTTNGPSIVLWYDNDYISTYPQTGYYRTVSLFDEYSNTTDYQAMKKDQLKKLIQNPGCTDKLFLLSWTLTPNQDTITNDALARLNPFDTGSNLQQLSATANRNLDSFLKVTCGYQINILYTDFYADAKTVDMAIQLNQVAWEKTNKEDLLLVE